VIAEAELAHPLTAIESPGRQHPRDAAQAGTRFGSRIGRAGNIAGNGVPEIIVGASNNDIPASCGVGRGGTNPDGTNQPPVAEGCFKNIGQAFIFDGATGELVRTREHPGRGPVRLLDVEDRLQQAVQGDGGPPRLGWTSAAAGDLNGDGEPDFLGGVPFIDVDGNKDQGRLYVFLSRAAQAQQPQPQGQTRRP
jgi:hypothetical protein